MQADADLLSEVVLRQKVASEHVVPIIGLAEHAKGGCVQQGERAGQQQHGIINWGGAWTELVLGMCAA